MRFFIFLLFIFCATSFLSQNNLRLFSSDGSVFKVILKDKFINKTTEADVLIEGILADTLNLKLEFESGQRFGLTIYLLEKGKPTKQKEFDYRIELAKNKIKSEFTGVYDIIVLPNPLVPKKPIVDTSSKYKNTMLGHFCELKDGNPIYFNNMPKEGICLKAMPVEYTKFIELLMSKADVADDRFTIAENTCRNNCLTVDQLKILLTYIDYEIEKLKLVRIGYFSLVDPSNQQQLEKSFRFESSHTELNNFLKNTGNYKLKSSTNCVKASEQNEIEGFISKLVVYNNDAQRLDMFKKAYTDLCYSTEQVTMILQKFIHDREKLEVAKLLYFRCTQKNTFLNVTEIFSYNQSASELKDFVEKQQN